MQRQFYSPRSQKVVPSMSLIIKNCYFNMCSRAPNCKGEERKNKGNTKSAVVTAIAKPPKLTIGSVNKESKL